MNTTQRIIKYIAMVFALILAIGIIGAITSVAMIVFGFLNTSESKEASLSNYSKSFENVKNISIDIATYDLNILPGEQVKVEASSVNDTFTADIKSGTLEIDEQKSFFPLFYNSKGYKKGKVDLYLPFDLELNKFNIDSGTGKLNIELLNTKELEIDSGTGSINGSNLIAKKVKIDSGTGRIYFENIDWTDTHIDCGTGSVTLNGILLGKTNIDSGTGSVSLQLKDKKENYNLDVDMGLGSFTVNGQKQPSELNLDNNAPNSLKIDGGTGSIKLDFLEQ